MNFNEALANIKRKSRLTGVPVSDQELYGLQSGWMEGADTRINTKRSMDMAEKSIASNESIAAKQLAQAKEEAAENRRQSMWNTALQAQAAEDASSANLTSGLIKTGVTTVGKDVFSNPSKYTDLIRGAAGAFGGAEEAGGVIRDVPGMYDLDTGAQAIQDLEGTITADQAWRATGEAFTNPMNQIWTEGGVGETAPQSVMFVNDVTGQTTSVPFAYAAEAYGMTPEAFEMALQSGADAMATGGELVGDAAYGLDFAGGMTEGGFLADTSVVPSAAGAIGALASAASKYSYELGQDIGDSNYFGYLMQENMSPPTFSTLGYLAKEGLGLEGSDVSVVDPLGYLNKKAFESIGQFFSGDFSGGFDSLWEGLFAPFSWIGDLFGGLF